MLPWRVFSCSGVANSSKSPLNKSLRIYYHHTLRVNTLDKRQFEMEQYRIVFIGDFLRPGPNAENNCKLIEALISPILKTVMPDVEIKLYGYGASIFHSLFQELSRASHAEWAARYADNELGRLWLAEVCIDIAPTLFISFEAPEYLYSPIVEAGFNIIDLSLHPYRFLDDFLFGLKTNIERLRRSLDLMAFPADLATMYAGLRQATVQRFLPEQILDGTTIFVGQTDFDRSLIDPHRGQIVTWEDYQETVGRIVEAAPEAFLCAHPMGSQKFLNFFEKRHPNIQLRCESIYSWLCDPRVTRIVALSSSTLWEAKVFGKEAIFLADHALNFKKLNLESKIYPLASDAVLSQKLFSQIASIISVPFVQRELSIPSGKNLLRTTFNIYYGYNYLDTDIVLWEAAIIQELRNKIDILAQVNKEMRSEIECLQRVTQRAGEFYFKSAS